MYLLPLIIPLINTILAWTQSNNINNTTIQNQLCTGILISWIISTLILYECIINESSCQTLLWSWINTDYLNCNITFILTPLSSSMLFIITTISLFVHLYSTNYMNNDPHTNRFMSYLSLFTFFMIILIYSNSILLLFVGWEGVGICSYLLINFWFTRIQANNAGVNAIIINRISDITLLISIILISNNLGSINFETISNLPTQQHTTTICILLLISATGNSSLIGLHIWLPDAMEGPTPVSALIHAATMVTAGIFLLIRSSHILENNNTILLLITWLGAITALFAATTGSFQNDINRIIAYSTCSQLGFMALTIGLSYFSISLLHLINHAFFNSLLFLGAGVTIHTLNNEQDLRNLSNLLNNTPLTYISIIIGSLTLIGLPFLTSYYSNDLIIEHTYNHSSIFWLTLISASLTALYSTRLIFFSFIQNSDHNNTNNTSNNDNDLTLNTTLILLSLLSISIGLLSFQYILNENIYTPITPSINITPLLCSSISIISIISIHLIEKNYSILNNLIFGWNNLISNAWYFNTQWNILLAQNALYMSNNLTFNTIDQGILEDISSNSISYSSLSSTNNISSIQSSNIHIHLITLIIFYTSFINT